MFFFPIVSCLAAWIPPQIWGHDFSGPFGIERMPVSGRVFRRAGHANLIRFPRILYDKTYILKPVAFPFFLKPNQFSVECGDHSIIFYGAVPKRIEKSNDRSLPTGAKI